MCIIHQFSYNQPYQPLKMSIATMKMSTAVSRRTLSPLKLISCCAKKISFEEDNSITASSKRGLETYELSVYSITASPKRLLEPCQLSLSVQGEPEAKRSRQCKLGKPHECPQCGRLYSDVKKRKHHCRIHTADSALLSWLGQENLNIC